MIFYFFSTPLIYRGTFAFFLSLVLFLILGKRLIKWLKRKKMVDYFRLYSPLTHKLKKGTPSGGGLFILFCLGLSFILLGNITNRYLYLALLATFSLGFLGFVDDVAKRVRKNSKGLSIKTKLLLQVGVSIFIAFCIYYLITDINTGVIVPFTNLQIKLGIFYLPFIAFIILSFSNAVNISDGLDGLTAGCMIAPAFFFIIVCFAGKTVNLSFLFNRTGAVGVDELAFFWLALLAALIGFLRYNRYPATLFMGGVGAEALGGALAISGILLKMELLLLLIGGVFVIEALSVVLQVISYRLTGKRIFKIAPLHHHFELNGAKESSIVSGFWVTSAFFSIVAFLSLILVR
ncbi:phospho-N-acetylmuramoyl-pentapeptide-transferase [Candidatus Aerophobetes bacterium]|nr:phospho-N-acetylmuramoyl-pentapeptide-transferase [Candidatus Aerophobetes bacterium]